MGFVRYEVSGGVATLTLAAAGAFKARRQK